MCGAFDESSSFETDQAGLFQSAWRTSDFCARVQLAATVGHRAESDTHAGSPLLVEHPGQKCEHQTRDRRQNSQKSGKNVGQKGHPHLGSWLCRQSVDHLGTQSSSAFHCPLEHSLPPGGTRWTQTRRLENRTRQAFLELPYDLGCAQTLPSKDGVIAFAVHLPEDHRPLFLVVSRPGYGRKPWYLLTTEPISTPQQAWQIIFAYARRCQIEMSLRFTKSELAFESPRLHAWEARLKFLLIASLAFAFLLSLLPHFDLLFRLLSTFCHRTGKWSQATLTPLYRLRFALARLWLTFRPHSLPSLTSG